MRFGRQTELALGAALLSFGHLAAGCNALRSQESSSLSRQEIEEMAQRAAPATDVSGPEPELPRVLMDTTYVAPAGATIAVGAGGDLQEALNRAQPGEVVSLEAGATFSGNFVLPNKTGAGWIVVRTAAGDSRLPGPGTRVGPATGPLMAKIVSPNSNPAIRTAPGAHHYRLLGLEVTVAAGVAQIFSLVDLGSGSQTLAGMPHDLILDRMYIHGNAAVNLRRGVTLNSASTAIIDSYISDSHEMGADSQAIGGWNGPGPFKIVNNYLEGAGENFMLGGADPSIPNLVSSDVEFRRNHCYKPLTWRVGDPSYGGRHWSVKNLFELKNAQRVLIDGNVFEHNWVDAQNGFAILFTVRNQDGRAPWVIVQDVTFTNNIVRHASGVFNISGRDENHPSQQSRRFKIANNLFEDIGAWWGGGGVFLQVGAVPNVQVNHNTVLQGGNVISAHAGPSPGFVFTSNIAPHNEYGISGDDWGPGNGAIGFYFPGGVFRKNVIAGASAGSYPPDNYYPSSLDQVKFVSAATGDYRLSVASRYKNAAADAKSDVGCDIEALHRAQQGPKAPAAGFERTQGAN